MEVSFVVSSVGGILQAKADKDGNVRGRGLTSSRFQPAGRVRLNELQCQLSPKEPPSRAVELKGCREKQTTGRVRHLIVDSVLSSSIVVTRPFPSHL